MLQAMSPIQPKTTKSSVVVPEELKKKHGPLIELILSSESMNDEERQYWINILPVMTPEQIENLRQILQNERDQLAAIDAKYAKEMEKLGRGKSVEEVGRLRRERSSARKAKERGTEEEERQKEEEILKAISELEG
jgi:hypothetical protein